MKEAATLQFLQRMSPNRPTRTRYRAIVPPNAKHTAPRIDESIRHPIDDHIVGGHRTVNARWAATRG